MTTESPESIPSIVKSLVSRFPALNEDLLGRYLCDIESWNRRIPLVSRKSTTTVLERLVKLSVLFREFIIEQIQPAPAFVGTKVVDIGTGAGFPGLIWKILDPASNITLVERSQKKSTFLRRMVVSLGLEGVEVVESDAKVASRQPGVGGSFDLAVSFAVGNMERVAPYIEPFLRPGGRYATLRPLAENCPPATTGGILELVATREMESGRFCLYRKAG